MTTWSSDGALLKDIDEVEFSLTYQGPLPSAQRDDTRAKAKQQIRRVFSEQLAALWNSHAALRRLKDHYLGEAVLKQRALIPIGHSVYAAPGIDAGAMTYPASSLFLRLGGYRFLPIVTRHLSLLADIHIDFLRRGRPGDLVSGGDLDNRVKTLFDALRLPQDYGELAGDTSSTYGNESLVRPDPLARPTFINPAAPPGAGTPLWSTKPIRVEQRHDPDPLFFTVLEDDALISSLSVETNQLLASAPGARETDVWLRIHVTVHSESTNIFNLGIS